MRAVTIATLAALVLIAALPSWAADTARHPAKPSSFAPRPGPKKRVYGAPIQPPILGQRKAASQAHKQTKAAAGTQKDAKKKRKPSGGSSPKPKPHPQTN